MATWLKIGSRYAVFAKKMRSRWESRWKVGWKYRFEEKWERGFMGSRQEVGGKCRCKDKKYMYIEF